MNYINVEISPEENLNCKAYRETMIFLNTLLEHNTNVNNKM